MQDCVSSLILSACWNVSSDLGKYDVGNKEYFFKEQFSENMIIAS